MIRNFQWFVLGIPAFCPFCPPVPGHLPDGIGTGLEDEQTRLAVVLDSQTGLDGLDAQMDVLLGRHSLDTQMLELEAILRVMIRPGDAVAVGPADLLDPLSVVRQRLLGLVVLRVHVPSSVGIPGQPQAHERVVEAPIYGPVAVPVGWDVGRA